jgi:DNA-directed RNA polymerase subunit F
MGYYRTIDGEQYDGELLDSADKAVEGKGDGRISMEDAKTLLAEVMDGASYTDTEKKTMAYIRDNYKWTPEADEWFRDEIRKWAATK